jgi:hypothetical protein
MALFNFLYRCPRCGADPMEGRGDEVRCPQCGIRVRRGGGGATLRVVEAGKEVALPAAELTAATAAVGGAGSLPREAMVTRSRSAAEEPVHHRGRLLGYAERQDEGEVGRLRLTDVDALFLQEERVRDRWPLLRFRALQSSSSLVQFSTPDEPLVQFRFQSDSPRRWEELFRLALQRAWRNAGRGEILEFQPRIVTR